VRLARSLSLAAALASTASAHPCRADDTLVAEAAFAEARTLMSKGLFAQACPKLEASYALAPALGTLMNLAECLRLTGRTASAWLRFRTAAAEALRLGQPEREMIARERATGLEPKLCRIVFRRDESAAPPGATLSRDGASPEPVLLDVAVPVDPGEHTFGFAAPGYVTHTVRFTVQGPPADGPCPDTPVAIPELAALPPAHPAVDAAGPTAAPIVASSPPWGVQRVVGLLTAAVGVASLGVGAGFGIDAISTNAAGNEKCTSQGCTPPGSTLLHHAGQSADTASWLLSIGAAAAVTGVVLWLLAPTRHRVPTAAVLRF